MRDLFVDDLNMGSRDLIESRLAVHSRPVNRWFPVLDEKSLSAQLVNDVVDALFIALPEESASMISELTLVEPYS